MIGKRTPIAALTLSAAGLVGSLARFLSEVFGWHKDRVLSVPAALYSPVDKLVANAADLRPFGHCDALPSAFQKYACALVPSLLCFGRPITVFMAVRAVVVSALNRVCWRRGRPHIRQEVVEYKPSFTNVNPPSAVICEVLGGWVGAACPQALPCVVFLRRLSAIFADCMAVPQVSSPMWLMVKTSAGLRVSSLERTRLNSGLVATFTEAGPSNAPAYFFRSFDYGKTTEFLTRKVDEFRHFVTSKWFTVVCAWRSAVNRFSGATLAKQFNVTGYVAC